MHNQIWGQTLSFFAWLAPGVNFINMLTRSFYGPKIPKVQKDSQVISQKKSTVNSFLTVRVQKLRVSMSMTSGNADDIDPWTHLPLGPLAIDGAEVDVTLLRLTLLLLTH